MGIGLVLGCENVAGIFTTCCVATGCGGSGVVTGGVVAGGGGGAIGLPIASTCGGAGGGESGTTGFPNASNCGGGGCGANDGCGGVFINCSVPPYATPSIMMPFLLILSKKSKKNVFMLLLFNANIRFFCAWLIYGFLHIYLPL
jgi:hypothetical protein